MSAITREVKDQGEEYTAFAAKMELYFSIPKNKETWEHYLDDALALLDLMADTKGEYGFNAIGIDMVLGAMAQLVESGYYGKDNSKVVTASVDKILDKLFKKEAQS